MNVKQFKRRWLNSKVNLEMFYAPVGKKKPKGKEMIFEITTTENNEIVIIPYLYYYDYVQNTFSNIFPLLVDKTDVETTGLKIIVNENGSIINRQFPEDFSIILDARAPDGQTVTPQTHPDYFIDWPYNSIETNQISTNMIMKDYGFEIDWGDGSITNITKNDIWTNVKKLDNGLTLTLHSSSFKNYNINRHTYEIPGKYIIKVKGNTPCFAIPKQCTKFIQWGNIGLRTLSYMFYNCQKLDELLVLPDADSLSHVYAAQYFCNSNISNISHEILNYADNIVICNYAFASLTKDIPDDFMRNKKYLSQCYRMFSANYSYSKCDRPITIGNNFMSGCSNLKTASYIFEYTSIRIIKNNFMSNCKNLLSIDNAFKECQYGNSWPYDNLIGRCSLEEIGSDFLSNCPRLIDIQYLFYYSKALKTIGDGMFSGCKSIRNAKDLLYSIVYLAKIPDDLFYDVKNNPDFCVNIFNFDEAFYKYYVGTDFFNSDFVTEIGNNMFSNEFWSSGMIIQITSSYIFAHNWSTKANDVPAHYNQYIHFSPYSGYYPDLWNHPESIYLYESRSKRYIKISDIQSGNYEIINNYWPNFNFALFGQDTGNYAFLGQTRVETFISNFNQIPKPVGYPFAYVQKLPDLERKKTAADCIWLRPIMSEFVHPAIVVCLTANNTINDLYMSENNSIRSLISINNQVYATETIELDNVGWVKYDEVSLSYLTMDGFTNEQWNDVNDISMLYLRITGYKILDTANIPSRGVMIANFDGESTEISSGGIGSFEYYSIKVTETETYLHQYLSGKADKEAIWQIYEGTSPNIQIKTYEIPFLANINLSKSVQWKDRWSRWPHNIPEFGLWDNATINFTSIRQPFSDTYSSPCNEKKNLGEYNNAPNPEVGSLSDLLIYDIRGRHIGYLTAQGSSHQSMERLNIPLSQHEEQPQWEPPYMPTNGSLTSTAYKHNSAFFMFTEEYNLINNGYTYSVKSGGFNGGGWVTSLYSRYRTVTASGAQFMNITFSVKNFLIKWAEEHYGKITIETGNNPVSNINYSYKYVNGKQTYFNYSFTNDSLYPVAGLNPPHSDWLRGLKIESGAMSKEEFNFQNPKT